jgi:hypothetical protein
MSTFTQSEQIGELIAALAKAQLEFGSAIKDSDNPFFKSKYADLAANINAVRPALNKHGIAVIQADSSELEHAIARVRTSLHCGEQWIASEAEAPAIDKSGNINVQTLGSAWTYLRRYTLQALCGLASEDDDGNSLSNGMTDGKKPAQTAAEKKWDEIDPELPRIGDTKGQLKAAVVKIDAEKRAASERNKLAQEQGVFSVENDILHCKIVGIQKKQTKPTPTKPAREFLSVTFNGRLSNGANFASVFDTELYEALNAGLDKEVKLKIAIKGAYVNVEDVLWVEGVGASSGMNPEPLFEGA